MIGVPLPQASWGQMILGHAHPEVVEAVQRASVAGLSFGTPTEGEIAWALGRLPPATAAVTVLVQPVVAALLGWLLFNEILSPWQMAGAIVALAGVMLAQWSSRTRRAT